MTPGTELVQVGKAVHPKTGEVYEIARCSDGNLAELLDAFKEAHSQLREFEGAVKGEVLTRMDRDAAWTIREGGYKVTGESPNLTEYDPDKLLEVLRILIREGLITAEAAKAALGQEVTLKPKKKGINALLKLGGQVAELVTQAEIPKAGARSVSVSRDS